MKHTLYLHGNLTEFGTSYEIEARTPHALITFLCRQIKGLKKLIEKGVYKLVRGKYIYDNWMMNQRYVMLDVPFGDSPQELHLIPCLDGSGDDGVGKTIIGAIIVVVAVAAAYFTGGTSLSLIGGLSVSYSSIAMFGATIMLAGISQLTAPKASTVSSESADETPSYFVTSPMNMVKENGAIPVAFGEVFTGSHIINASLRNLDIL